MGKKEDTAYQEWVESLSGRLSEESIKILTSDEGAREVFRGHLREDEFHRRLSELDLAKKQLQTEKETLEEERSAFSDQKEKWQNWYVETSSDFERVTSENEELKKKIQTPAPDQKVTAPQGGTHVDEEANRKLAEATKRIETINMTLPRLIGDYGDVLTKITQEGWKVQPKELLNTALTRGVDMETAFYELTAKERAEREEAALKQIEAEAYERGKREAQSSAPPDSFRGTLSGNIDHLRKPVSGNSIDRVANAVRAYEEMRQGA